MYNFCTLFDSSYLHKGLGLYQSLTNVCENFQLYVFAFDDECYNVLAKLNLPKLTIISLDEFETQELLAIKPTRTKAEYCWTCGPSIIFHCINKFNLNHCTYVDADLMFYSSPEIVYKEIIDSSVAITEHIPNGPNMIAGKYCVQFVYFKNDEDGMNALNWWRKSCIDWCYARYEDGKFGDQKYLDSFPILFKNIHIIKNNGVGVAPWNVHLYDFSDFGKIIFENNAIDIVFFHYHGTGIEISNDSLKMKVITSDVNKNLKKNIYLPYLELLQDVYSKYFNIKINTIKVNGRSIFMSYFFKIKKMFRHNTIFQFIYYKVFSTQYNGYDKIN